MHRKFSVFSVSLAAMAGAFVFAHPVWAGSPASPSRMVAARSQSPQAVEEARLMALFRADAARSDALNPIGMLYRGETTTPAALAELYTPRHTLLTRQAIELSLAELRKIDRARLGAERQISYDAFQRDQNQRLSWLAPDILPLVETRPINHFYGIHSEFPSLFSSDGPLPHASAADYRRNLALLRAVPTVLGNVQARMAEGMASGVVETRMTARNMVAQIDALLAQPVEDSPFYATVKQPPRTLSATARAGLAKEWRDTIQNEIYPAYRRLRTFINDRYLPASRETVGLSTMKGGATIYRKLIEENTTLPLDPEEVHRLGLSEVARIQQDMDAVRQQLGFAGDLKQFFEAVRTDPRFHPKSKDELSAAFTSVARIVDAKVPEYFLRRPKTGLQITPYPPYREKFEAGGSYNSGSADGKRPGVFYYNTYDLPSRFLSGVNTLYLHEAAPGHHFQISLAQENTALPDFQRFGGNNAYVEGWALYAETLGYPMGLFKDPLQHWGTLDDEMLRAMRLVVDTGLHAKGWSREQAIAYMLANSGMGKTDATAEVERYIAIPGQALGYKIGALTIQRLRKKAEQALGSRFDIRQFHDQVLGSGALPLPILEAKIDRWIAVQKQ